jgi:hypothetical protein
MLLFDTVTTYAMPFHCPFVGFGVGIIPITFMSMKYGTRFTLGGMTLAWGEQQQQ